MPISGGLRVAQPRSAHIVIVSVKCRVSVIGTSRGLLFAPRLIRGFLVRGKGCIELIGIPALGIRRPNRRRDGRDAVQSADRRILLLATSLHLRDNLPKDIAHGQTGYLVGTFPLSTAPRRIELLSSNRA